MNSVQITAAVLLVLGVLALAYGGFTYTKETHSTDIGPISLSVDDRERVNIPVWAGVGAVFAGGMLFLFGRGRRR